MYRRRYIMSPNTGSPVCLQVPAQSNLVFAGPGTHQGPWNSSHYASSKGGQSCLICPLHRIPYAEARVPISKSMKCTRKMSSFLPILSQFISSFARLETSPNKETIIYTYIYYKAA